MAALASRFNWPLTGTPVCFDGVSTDTRELRPGQLYIALVGDRFDGHDYVAQALAAGAAGALVSRPLPGCEPLLIAPDTLLGLGEIAAAHREAWGGRLFAITGSAGKTSTKEMLACILGLEGPVCATRGNLNNEIGVPLTLLQLRPEHTAAVIEMGAAKPGDIAYLAALASPSVSIITNAMPAHLQGFGDLSQVARTKGEIYGRRADQISVINLDSRFAGYWLERAQGSRIVGFSAGGNPAAEVAAREIELRADGSRFLLDSPLGSRRVALAVPGAHCVANALAAAAAALAGGRSLDSVGRGLEQFGGVSGRLQPRRTADGMLLLDDSYNANPEAVDAALEVLSLQPGPRLFIFGDMAELGPDAGDHHRGVGARAGALGIEQLIAVGGLAALAAEAFGPQAQAFDSQAALLDWAAGADLSAHYRSCLVKGSRSARMENIVSYLLGDVPGYPASEEIA